MMAALLSPVPAINIHYAGDEQPIIEPASPFDRLSFNPSLVDQTTNQSLDTYRPSHLLPPPVLSPKQQESQAQREARRVGLGSGRGLDPIRFQALLNAAKTSTTGRASASAPYRIDLRKEVAIRAHHSRQLERRATFLSKLEALPSPTAASTPVTPPESPAIFHFTLPSPGLVSPLALFETLEKEKENGFPSSTITRVEQVDFRALARKEAEELSRLTGNVGLSHKVCGLPRGGNNAGKQVSQQQRRKGVPTLDQLSKRLGGNVTITRPDGQEFGVTASTGRLPAFLKKHTMVETSSVPSLPPSVTIIIDEYKEEQQQAPAVVEAPVPIYENQAIPQIAKTFRPMRSKNTRGHSLSSLDALMAGSGSISLPQSPAIAPIGGDRLTAQALDKLAVRNEKGSAMVEKLRKRLSAPVGQLTVNSGSSMDTKKMRGGF